MERIMALEETTPETRGTGNMGDGDEHNNFWLAIILFLAGTAAFILAMVVSL